MSALRFVAALAVPLLFAAGCGGGGGDVDAGGGTVGSGGTTDVTTYGSANLPGKILVTDPTGPASLYNLRTGQGQALAPSASGSNRWTGSTSPGWVVRTSESGANFLLERIRTSDWTQVGPTTQIGGNLRRPRVSPDGRYFLTFWQDTGELATDGRLTVFDADTGQIVKRGSPLNGAVVVASPAAWLPDGRYLVLAGRNLYVSSPSSQVNTLVRTLDLPDNSALQDGQFDSTGTQLSVSPDGTKIAFNWGVRRPKASGDQHLWVANADGTNLHQITAPPDAESPLNYGYGNPTWSPDSQWVLGVLYMAGTVVAPIYPPDLTFPGVPGGIIGSTGCASSPVFVLPANADKVAVRWPSYDTRYGIKVRNASGQGGQWVSTCASVYWVQ